MGLLQRLVETYDTIAEKYAGVTIEGMREPLAPVSHALQKAQIEITLSEMGDFIDAKIVPKKESRTLIPVTLKSANRSSNKSPHPFAEQLEYLSSFDKKLQEEYLEQLHTWDTSPYGNLYTNAVYTYIKKSEIIHDLYKKEILESEAKEDMSKKKVQSTIYKKCLVRWIVREASGKVTKTWEEKSICKDYIAFYNNFALKDTKKGICMVTGECVPLTDLHAKNIFPLQSGAKLISSNDKQEYTFRGTYIKNPEDTFTMGYEASQKAHNMLRWLLNNFGVIVGNKMYLYWCPEGKYVPSPFEDNTRDDETVSNREILYQSIFGSDTESLSKKDHVILASFESMTTGRLALTYYSEFPANTFLTRIYKWKESFVSDSDAWLPSIYMMAKYAYGVERKGTIVIENGIYSKRVEELIGCKLYNHPIPASLIRELSVKASYPIKYKALKNRRYITYITALVVRKDENEKAGKEVYPMTLDKDNNDVNYLLGRLLAVYEKAELDTYTEAELKHRIPNAVRYHAMYVQRPAATLLVLKRKIVPYLNKLKRRKNELYIKYQSLFDEIFEKIDGREVKLDKKLEDTYILGYYHQRESFYHKFV